MALPNVILLTVARGLSTPQLEILRARLDAEGIPAYVINGGINQLYSLGSIAMGGAKLQVPQEYADDARALIAALNSGVLAATNDDVEGQDG